MEILTDKELLSVIGGETQTATAGGTLVTTGGNSVGVNNPPTVKNDKAN